MVHAAASIPCTYGCAGALRASGKLQLPTLQPFALCTLRVEVPIMGLCGGMPASG